MPKPNEEISIRPERLKNPEADIDDAQIEEPKDAAF